MDTKFKTGICCVCAKMKRSLLLCNFCSAWICGDCRNNLFDRGIAFVRQFIKPIKCGPEGDFMEHKL